MFFLCTDYCKRKEKSSLPGWRKKDCRKECRERMSLSASYKGSLTVEAACVLPVFLYAALAFLNFFQIVSTAGRVAEGLQDAGKQIAVYAYAKEEAVGDEKTQAAGIVSLLYAKNRIHQAVGQEAPAISLMRSSVLEGDEMIDLVAEYRFRWKIPFPALSDIPVLQRARIRAWTGRSGTGDGSGKEKNDTTVYVTVNGSVYHKSRECTHIRLSVHSASKNQISGLRNVDGGKYYPCETCGGNGSKVYITETGNRYHSSVTCSGLKRGVIAVPLSQVEEWKPCSRCGK